MIIHFISDLHLSCKTPDIFRRFTHYLTHQACGIDALYILGDLFEAWTGDDSIDDADDQSNLAIVNALAALTKRGTALYLMQGNRDFLLGEAFAARAGGRLLPDPFVLSIPTTQFVLSHGDSLCVDDAAYMAYRAKVRHPEWQKMMLAQPLAVRKAAAQQFREQSDQSKQEKSPDDAAYFDLNLAATEDFIRQYGYACFIHGHTHCPKTHTHIIDGIHVERWVLADWNADYGEALSFDSDANVLQRIAL